MKVLGRFALLVLLASGSAALAEAPEDDPGMRQNCVNDYFRFCAAYAPGTDAIKRCFGSNMRHLSSPCRAAIEAFDRRRVSKAQN